MIGAALSGQHSKSRTGVTFRGPTLNSRKGRKEIFCSSYSRSRIQVLFRISTSISLAQSRDKVSERIVQNIDTERCRISVVWSVNEIYRLLDVPKETIYNNTFFSDVVVPDLVRNLCTQSETDLERNFGVSG
jgi:hypothetical protein